MFHRADRRKLVRGSGHDSDSRGLISVTILRHLRFLFCYRQPLRWPRERSQMEIFHSTAYHLPSSYRSHTRDPLHVSSRPISNLLANKAHSIRVRGALKALRSEVYLHYRSTDQIWKLFLQYLYKPNGAEKNCCGNAAISGLTFGL